MGFLLPSDANFTNQERKVFAIMMLIILLGIALIIILLHIFTPIGDKPMAKQKEFQRPNDEQIQKAIENALNTTNETKEMAKIVYNATNENPELEEAFEEFDIIYQFCRELNYEGNIADVIAELRTMKKENPINVEEKQSTN